MIVVINEAGTSKFNCRGHSIGCSKRSLETLLCQYDSPVSSIREEALDAMLGLFCDEPAHLPGLQLAVADLGPEVLKRICVAMSQSAGSSRSTDGMLSLSSYEIQRGADVIHSLLLAVPPFAVTKLVPGSAEVPLHKVCPSFFYKIVVAVCRLLCWSLSARVLRALLLHSQRRCAQLKATVVKCRCF